MPANLFYGTGIAASLIVIDREDAKEREDIFLIDASKGYIKDGNKNRLREQDIHQIVDTFNNRIQVPKYSRIIPVSEIANPKNDYNLNIPRYIDSQEEEDIQDIEAHLVGGIPKRDIDALQNYWTVYPSLKNHLFSAIENRPNYYQLNIGNEEIKNTIFNHPEFTSFGKQMDEVFGQWCDETTSYVKSLDKEFHPKQEILRISETLLKAYENKALTDRHAMFQHLMDYWAETMQDDFYELTADGWKAGNELKRIEKKIKKGDKEFVKQVIGLEGLEGRLIPPGLIIKEYLAKEQKVLDDLEAQAESLTATMDELREENGGEEGLLANATDNGKISKGNLQKALKDLGRRNTENAEEYDMLQQYKKLMDTEAEVQVKIKVAKVELEKKVIAQYPKLSIAEIKTLAIEKKWMAAMEQRIRTEMDNISHRLTQRIKELAERYETPMPRFTENVADLEAKVNTHLTKMGFVWK